MRHLTILFLLLSYSVTLLAQTTLEEARKLVEAKKYDEAKKVFQSVIKQDKKNAEAYYEFGKLLLNHYRDLSEAVDNLEEAAELDEKNAEYHWILGVAYGARTREANIFSQMSLAGKTRNEFAKAVELDPKSVKYRASLLNYYLLAPGIAGGSISRAKEQAAEIMKLDKYSGHLHFGQIAAEEDDFSLAEQEYRKATEIDPGEWRPYHLLGYLYLNQKRYNEAIEQFNKYVDVAPDDANSYDSLGEALMEKGNTDDAINQFRKALTIDPRFSASIYNLAQCYEKKNMLREALESYKLCLEVDPRGNYAGSAEKKIKQLSK